MYVDMCASELNTTETYTSIFVLFDKQTETESETTRTTKLNNCNYNKLRNNT